MQAHLDLLAVLIKIRIVALIIMTDVKAEAKAVEGAKQVSWFHPTLLRKFVRLLRRQNNRIHGGLYRLRENSLSIFFFRN